MRPAFESIFLQLAQLMAKRSTCLRLQVGAVVTTTDHRRVLAIGYNGNASGAPNQCDVVGEAAVGGCGCLHAEENAIINLDSPRGIQKIFYTTHSPCMMCAKRIVNVGGVVEVRYLEAYRITAPVDFLIEMGLRVTRMEL